MHLLYNQPMDYSTVLILTALLAPQHKKYNASNQWPKMKRCKQCDSYNHLRHLPHNNIENMNQHIVQYVKHTTSEQSNSLPYLMRTFSSV